MIKVDINNRQKKIPIEENMYTLLKQVAEEAAASEGFIDGELSITLVDNGEIRDLNKKYRHMDVDTDVLSFPIGEEILGDIVISVEKARLQSREYGHSFTRELCYLLTHGILHLCGYNHKNEKEQTIMRKKEEEILSSFNLVRSDGGG